MRFTYISFIGQKEIQSWKIVDIHNTPMRGKQFLNNTSMSKGDKVECYTIQRKRGFTMTSQSDARKQRGFDLYKRLENLPLQLRNN